MIYLFYSTLQEAENAQQQIYLNRYNAGIKDKSKAGAGEILNPQITQEWADPIELNGLWGIPKPDVEFLENVVQHIIEGVIYDEN